MRPALRHSLLACLSLAVTPVRAESTDPSDVFLEAYLAFQKGEKLESAGNARSALSAFQSTVAMCDQITKQWPDWNPPLVENRRNKGAEAVARLQPLVGKTGGPRPDDDQLIGALPKHVEEPIIPGTDSLTPPKRGGTATARNPATWARPCRIRSTICRTNSQKRRIAWTA